MELSHLSEVTDDQFNLVHHEIRRYSRVIKGILESIQDAEPLLAANRHRRIKQATLDAHATELQMFTAEYGEMLGRSAHNCVRARYSIKYHAKPWKEFRNKPIL